MLCFLQIFSPFLVIRAFKEAIEEQNGMCNFHMTLTMSKIRQSPRKLPRRARWVKAGLSRERAQVAAYLFHEMGLNPSVEWWLQA
jgi:hypothetical protein